jgi:hypothetical protein
MAGAASATAQCTENRVEHRVQFPADVFGEEPQDEVAVLHFPKVKIPTAADEQRDPEGALEIYTACCDKLRGLLRAQKEKFADVHRENTHYGFRRNLWALKPAGIVVTFVALASVGAEMFGSVSARQSISLVQPVVAAIDGLLLFSWIFLITESWVKRAAVLYAERFMEALDTLV